MLTQIILSAIGVLILVILIPVFVALIRNRMKRMEEQKAEARPRGPVKTTPVPSMSEAAPSAPPLAPPSPKAPPPSIDATQLGSHDSGDAPPQATEFVQWYGMIVCTKGVLEGQRFIIEPDGIYIGRDSGMSQVVINDSRISKRHVRIVPRDGKVHAMDEGSTNGTFVGGQRITDVVLKRGDVLTLADEAASFLYQI